jgi:hypothetical protein
MNLIDRLLLIVAIVMDIFLVYFISERSIVFSNAMIELIVGIGAVCLTGWIVEWLMSPRKKNPEITIERLDQDYQHLETVNQWCIKHKMELGIAEKLEIIRSYKDKRLALGALQIAYITNIAMVVLAAAAVVITITETVVHNLLDSASNCTANASVSKLAQFQLQNMSNDMWVICFIAVLIAAVGFLNLYFYNEATKEQ